APQVVTLDVATGRQRQLTSLPHSGDTIVAAPRFVDDRTIAFWIGGVLAWPLTYYTIKTDGSGFAALPAVVASTSGAVVPDFSLVGGRTHLLTSTVPGQASDVPYRHPREVFVFEGRNLLQLTNFGRWGTAALFLGSRRRVLSRS